MGKTIPNTNSPTFLGVTYDTPLTFTKHVERVTSKMTQRLRLLERLGGEIVGAVPETSAYSFMELLSADWRTTQSQHGPHGCQY